MHWKKLCEENVQDINKEIELIRQGENRLVELTKKDSKVYPRYRAKIKQLQNYKSDVETLAKKFPNCIQRDCNVFIPLSRHKCLNKLYCCLRKRFRKTRKNEKFDLTTDIRIRFGDSFEKTVFSEMKRKYFRKYFRKLGIETENLTPALMATDKKHRAKTIKIVIYDRMFAFKHMLGVPLLSRINEVQEIIRPRSSLSLLTRSRRLSTNILRKTYTVSKSGLICKPDGDMTNIERSESLASKSLEVNRHPPNTIFDYFVNRKLTPYESCAESAEDSDPCSQNETSMTKSFSRSLSAQDYSNGKQKVSEEFNDDHCTRSKQIQPECPFGPISIIENKPFTTFVGKIEPKCPAQSEPIARNNSFTQKESSKLDSSCNTAVVAVDIDSLPNQQNKPIIHIPQAESTILENPCSLASFTDNTSSLIKRPTRNLIEIPCRSTSIEIDTTFVSQKRTKPEFLSLSTHEIDNSIQLKNADHKMSDDHCLVENSTNHETSATLDTRLITDWGKLKDRKSATIVISENPTEQIKPEGNCRLPFPRGAPLPRISSTPSQKSTEEIHCKIEGHAITKRPQSGLEAKCNKNYVSSLLKITRELPPMVNTQKVIKPVKTYCKQRGFDLETSHIENKPSKDHIVHKNRTKTKPNSPVKRVRRISRTPHHVDIMYSAEEKDDGTIRETHNPPLPPIKDQKQSKQKWND